MIKPVNWFSGLGIKISDKLDDILLAGGKVVVQEYIDRPQLLHKRKCDVRVFILVTSIDPLILYVYNDGVVSICSQEYSNDNYHSKPAHMTNYSINKAEDNFSLKDQRWRLRRLWSHLTDLGLDTEAAWQRTK